VSHSRKSRQFVRAATLLLATSLATGALALTSVLPARAATAATDDTAADFQLGTRTSTYVADSSGGEVTLAPTAGAEFGGTTLETGWTSTQWDGATGTTTVSGGKVSLDGTHVQSPAAYPVGGSLEFDATFAYGVHYQHVGLAVDLNADTPTWAIFTTGSGDGTQLFTSVDNGAPDPTAFSLGETFLGSSHHYRIDWHADSIVFSVDGTPVRTEPISISTPMSLVASDLAVDSAPVTVNWMRLSPYTATGTFTSRVLDAGGPADWGTFSWTSTVPTGTTLALSVRTGNTATPDGTWSTFAPITSGSDVTTYGRYLQYQATETTTDTNITPALASVSAAYTVDAVAPTISSHTPTASATDVALNSTISVTFSEAVSAASGAAVTVRAAGASSDVATATPVVSGSTVTLTPSANLAYGTSYTVSVSTAASDLVGNHLASAASWSFTTVFGTLTAGTPSITGTLGVGQTLTADEGTWTPVPDFTYKWYRGSTQVGTARTYVVTTDDVGYQLSVEVTGTKAGYTTAARTSAATVTIAEGTLSTATPTISDTTPVIGQVLTADAGTWGPDPVDLSYQWLRGGVEINGATAQTYTVTGADAEHSLSVRVTGTKVKYTTASKTSAETTAVPKGALSPTPAPTISGTVVVGKVLTADPGTWGPGTVELTYQWLRGSSAISGAVAKTYTVSGADAGATLAVRVTGTKQGYTPVSMTSAATGKVPSILAPNPTVTGVARVGMPLKAVPGTWVPTPTKVSYQWYWLKSSGARVTIKHATKAAYTPTTGVQGRRIEVRIKAYKGGQLIATRYSAPTVKVAAGMTGKTPKISDSTPAVGQILTAKTGTWKPAQTTFAYQWYAKSTSGKVSRIAGATGPTYQVDARYAGYKLKVRVTGTAPDYKSVAKTSSYTHKITK